MKRSGSGEFGHTDERSPLEIARDRWGVNLDDDRATLNQLVEFQGKMPDVADLGNLWLEHQRQRGADSMREAA